MQKKQTDKRKRGGQISSVQVMFAAILSIGMILAINFSTRITEGQPLQVAYSRVSDEIVDLQAEHARLTAQRDYVLSDAYVEQWARADGKMVRPGEVLVVPVPAGIEAETTPEPQVSLDQVRTTPQENPPWVLWWQIFFDSPPPGILSPGGS
ncbi:MAG: septum formation initiator family protein [Anaerolineae bacterium]